MKFGKRAVVFALAVALSISFLPMDSFAANTASSGMCGDNITWALAGDGTLTISGNGDMEEYSLYSEVPWYDYREKIVRVIISPGVTSIAPYAFWRDENLQSISIPEGITKIGEVSFLYCTSLTEIQLPGSLTQIGYSAFSDCDMLASVGSISNVMEIGHHAFFGCKSLESVDISNAVTIIKSHTFHGCERLKSVGDLSNVTQIQENAFYNCRKLQSINSLENVIKFGNEAFSGCTSLTTVGTVNPNATVGTDAFHDCIRLAERDSLDPEAAIHDYLSDWYTNNKSRIGWINLGTYPSDPDDCGSETVKVVNSVCKGLTDDLSKARALYDWTINNICYDRDKESRGGLSAWLITDEDRAKLVAAGGADSIFNYQKEDVSVILQRGVCSDISWMYLIMLDLVGIPARVISCRIAGTTDPHACVMAYMGGEWRFFDPTLDINGRYIGQTYYFKPADSNWRFFNMDLERFSQGHYLDEKVGAVAEDTPNEWAQDEVFRAQLLHLVPFKLQSKYTRNITREEFCELMMTLMGAALGQNLDEYVASQNLSSAVPFTDTDNAAILAAYAMGIVSGTSETTFNPDGLITRQEAATMVARTAKALKLTASGSERFQDTAQFASWSRESIAFVSGLTDPDTGAKVMGGIGGGMFSPLTRFTREQAILTALRLYDCV